MAYYHALDTQLYVGLKAFIKRGNKVLVMKDRDSATLDFPGGKYRAGNNIESELLREIDEETGLSVKIGKPFHVWADKYSDKKDVFLIGFLCEYISGDVRLSDEHEGFEWVDLENSEKWKENTGYWDALVEYFKVMGS